MAAADLHKFKDDLKAAPGPGSDAPPRTIRADDLDGNFKKVMLIESDDVDPVPYEIEHTENGTRLKSIKQLPDGGTEGDLAYWNPEAGNNGAGKWVVLKAKQSQELHVLGIIDGKLRWVKTENCP
jgi:hypothetical protein